MRHKCSACQQRGFQAKSEGDAQALAAAGAGEDFVAEPAFSQQRQAPDQVRGDEQRIDEPLPQSRWPRVSNGAALGWGAVSLSSLGEPVRANEWIDRALMIDPDNNTMRYNLACSLATYLKDIDKAIELLGPYFDRVSVSELKHCAIDPDMDPLRDDPRFRKMVVSAKARLGVGDELVPRAEVPPPSHSIA